MGSLKSVNDVPGITHYEYRDIPYWSKFKYRLRIHMNSLFFLNWNSDVDDWVEAVTKNKGKGVPGIPKQTIDDAYIKETLAQKNLVANLLDLRESKRKSKEGDYSVRIEYKSASVFSNDLAFLQSIHKDYPNVKTDCTEARTSEVRGTKYFVKTPKANFRVYLRSVIVDPSTKKDLYELFERTKTLSPSRALKEWLEPNPPRSRAWRSKYCSSTYYIDYHTESTLSYLALIQGDLLGKRFKLEKRP